MTHQKEIWFKAKIHGWGWGPPICWKGWVVVGGYVALILLGAVRLAAYAIRFNQLWLPLAWYLAYVGVLSVAMLFVCWCRGPRPRWRSGGKDSGDYPVGYCQACGYDLTGNASGRCPECGEPTSATS